MWITIIDNIITNIYISSINLLFTTSMLKKSLLSTLATLDEPPIWLNTKSTEYNSWTVTVEPAASVVNISFLISVICVADTS